MDTIFIYLENLTDNILLNLTDKINLKRGDKYVVLAFTIHGTI